MTGKDKMEQLSKRYLECIANSCGYMAETPGKDYGVDLQIRQARFDSSQRRYYMTGKMIDLQVKSVTEKYAKGFSDSIASNVNYSLEVKNYNDLVRRSRENGLSIPLFLIIFILPNKIGEWVNLEPEELIMKKCAFWFQVGKVPFSKRRTRITVHIPKTNRISTSFYKDVFDSLD